MNEENLKQLGEKLLTAPFVCVFADKTDEKSVVFHYCTNKTDGPTLAYMHSLIAMHLMQGVVGATRPPEAPRSVATPDAEEAKVAE